VDNFMHDAAEPRPVIGVGNFRSRFNGISTSK
jgi:hypothetical protein